MPDYDPVVIHKFADQLYKVAETIVRKHTVLGTLIGVGIGLPVLAGGNGPAGLIAMGILGALFGSVGRSMGMEKAFKYKLEAQQALCFVEIEKNSRS